MATNQATICARRARSVLALGAAVFTAAASMACTSEDEPIDDTAEETSTAPAFRLERIEGFGIEVGPYTAFFGAGDFVLQVRGPESDDEVGGAVFAYDLGTGEAAWESPVPLMTYDGILSAAHVDGIAVFSHSVSAPCEDAYADSADDYDHCLKEMTSAYDVESGDLLWQWYGFLLTMDREREVIVVQDNRTPDGEGWLNGINLATGELAWSYTDPAQDDPWNNYAQVGFEEYDDTVLHFDSPSVSDHLVVFAREYLVDQDQDQTRVWVLETNSGRETGSLDSAANGASIDEASVIGGAVIIRRWEGYEAYSPDGLEELWSIEAEFADEIYACGPWICIWGASEGAIAVDPLTGETARSGGAGDGIVFEDELLLVSSTESHYDGDPGFDRAAVCTLDPCDSVTWNGLYPYVETFGGAEVLDVRDWHVTGIDGSRLLLLRSTGDPWAMSGDAEFAVADLRERTVHPLGVIRDVQLFAIDDPGYPAMELRGCAPVGGKTMGCRKTDGTVAFYRFES